MQVIVIPVLEILGIALQWYIYAIVVMAVMSWLVAFNVINTRNRFVYSVLDILNKITEPALRPIRRIMPDLGGVDLSPIILILILALIQRVLVRIAYAAM